jgi:hypothetical protein
MAIRGSDGRFIEDGIGSPGRETPQHLAALAKTKSAIPSGGDLKSLLDLYESTKSDKAAAERTKALHVVADEARKATAQAEAAQRVLDRERLQHLQTMADQKAKFEAHMDQRRDEIEAEAATKLKDVLAREAEVTKRERELDGLVKGYTTKVGELDEKLQAIRKAAR